MSSAPESSLRRLAASYGIQTSYWGVDGRRHHALPEVLLALLRAMGAPVASFDDVDPALRGCREASRARIVEPVILVWDEENPSFLCTLPSELPGRALEGVIVCEDGTEVELDGGLERQTIVRERAGFVRRRVSLPELPWGYHRLSLDVGGRPTEALMVRAPRNVYRSPDPSRRWGLFAPLYAAQSDESWGAGDFSDLERLCRRTAEHGGRFFATLPFFAAAAEEPSPYSPASRLFWNELYIDPRMTPEWESSSEARSLATTREFQDKVVALRDEPLVDYRALMELKRPVLEKLAGEARRSRPGALDAFREGYPLALDYARFRAICEREGPFWHLWPETHRQGLIEEGDASEDRVLYHLYCQMTAERQLEDVRLRSRENGVDLYLDLPLGVLRSGYDTWREATLFAHDVDVGAPPDAVFTDGQNWSFPPVLPRKSREQGHRYLRLCFRKAMQHASMLRIDHVMGLHRQFWIPQSAPKRDGVYVRYPAEELYAVLSLESHRARCELVGENLGMVPDAVNESLARHRMRGIYVLQFSLTGNPSEPALPVPAGTVASLNTHDTPLFAGFCEGADLRAREEQGLIGEDQLREGLESRAARIRALDVALGVPQDDLETRLERWLAFLFSSDAERLLVTLEDLWLERQPQNVPGSAADRPNWRRKLRHRPEALPGKTVALLEKLAHRLS